ncbi:hypothetical protein D3C72_1260200 [compost metagenome]
MGRESHGGARHDGGVSPGRVQRHRGGRARHAGQRVGEQRDLARLVGVDERHAADPGLSRPGGHGQPRPVRHRLDAPALQGPVHGLCRLDPREPWRFPAGLFGLLELRRTPHPARDRLVGEVVPVRDGVAQRGTQHGRPGALRQPACGLCHREHSAGLEDGEDVRQPLRRPDPRRRHAQRAHQRHHELPGLGRAGQPRRAQRLRGAPEPAAALHAGQPGLLAQRREHHLQRATARRHRRPQGRRHVLAVPRAGHLRHRLGGGRVRRPDRHAARPGVDRCVGARGGPAAVPVPHEPAGDRDPVAAPQRRPGERLPGARRGPRVGEPHPLRRGQRPPGAAESRRSCRAGAREGWGGGRRR